MTVRALAAPWPAAARWTNPGATGSKAMGNILAIACLIVGLYIPTSIDGTIARDLHLAASFFLLLVLGGSLLRRNGFPSAGVVVNAIFINVILLVCTLLSGLTDFAYGGFVPPAVLSVVLCSNVRDIPLTPLAARLFSLANAVNLTCGLLLALQVPEVARVFTTFYANGYPELVPYMLAEAKPVLMFHSHSVAGFYCYLFFYLTLRTFAHDSRKILYLMFAFGYIGLLICLHSFTGYILAGVALAQIFFHFQWQRSAIAGLILTALAIAGLTFVVSRFEGFEEFTTGMIDVLRREQNGLNGRYSSTGGLIGNIRYIADHPFSPVGTGFSSDLFYGDSGPLEYMLRGSFWLVACVYGGLYLFLRRNLVSRREANILMLTLCAFELGYSNLQYFRTHFLLPFFVVYLNGITAPLAGRLRA